MIFEGVFLHALPTTVKIFAKYAMNIHTIVQGKICFKANLLLQTRGGKR